MTAFVEVGGARLRCRVDGPEGAPALVLAHSLGTDLEMWRPQVEALAGRFRVVRYDGRGHGGSDVPPGPYTLERLGLDLVGLLDALGLARAHVGGVSLGGLVALWLAANRPERVDRLLLANTAARIGSAESWAARIEAVERGGMAAIRDAVLARFLSAPFRARRPDEAERVGQMLDLAPPQGYVAVCAALRDADLRGALGRVRAPTLIVAGELDESTPPAQAEELHRGIAGSELLVLPAAHLSNLEQPEQFNRRVGAFLAGHDQAEGQSP